jgi:type IV secretion system protein VirB4
MRLKKYQSKKYQLFEREIPLSRHIPISHFNANHVFETKNGTQGIVLQVEGYPYALSDKADLNHCQRVISNLLLGLNEEFAFYTTVIRRKDCKYPSGDFPVGFAQDFDHDYRLRMQQKQLYRNDIYLTVMIKGPDKRFNTSFSFLQKISKSTLQHTAKAFRERQKKQKDKLENVVKDVLIQLQPFRPRVLGDRDQQYSEVLEFFSYLINGKQSRCRYPLQDVASYLPSRRLCFGHNTLQWIGNTLCENQFGAMVSIKKYGPDSSSVSLDSLLSSNVEFIQTHSFLRIPNPAALHLIRKQHKHLIAVEDASHSQQEELNLALDLLASDRLGFGYHHNTVLVLASQKEELEEKIAQMTKCYRDADIVAVRESLNLESAFWSQLPGNFFKITRSALISTDNFADYCSLHNESTGYVDQNHLGSSVLLVETPNRTPLYINFHERSQGKQDISKGHTTLIAPSNAGKTTLMNALDLGAKKYQGTSIFFDRDRGCEIYIRAMRGCYQRIHPAQTTGFNPLQLEDNEANRHFLVRWLQALIESDGRKLEAGSIKQIETVVQRNFTLPFDKRRLSFLVSFFPNDFALETLFPWLQGGESPGRLAYLFDNSVDALSLKPKMLGFDMTHLLDQESQAVVFPVLLYLFHRIEALFTGDLVGIYLDEGWQYLENPYWKEKLKAYLPSLRKKNVYMIFATQSPGTVANSTLRDELISGSATNIFLPNPKASREDYCDAFKLSEREYDFIKNTAHQTRQFLIKQGRESAIGRLDLSGLEQYAAVLAANQQSLNLLDELIQRTSDDPEIWLPLFYEKLLCR